MVIRTRRRDGKRFWGCTEYPRCRETYEMGEEVRASPGVVGYEPEASLPEEAGTLGGSIFEEHESYFCEEEHEAREMALEDCFGMAGAGWGLR